MPPLIVQVPASATNLGPGFDTLGVALTLYNQLELEELPWGLSIQVEGEGEKELPRDETNVVFQAVRAAYERAGRKLPGLWIKERNHIPLCRGLGSGAAARVGGLVGANELMGRPLPEEDLLDMAAAMEGHPDNAVPTLKGGLCVAAVGEGGRVRYAQVRLSERFQFVVAMPGFLVPTPRARAVLPPQVPLSACVFNLQRLGLLLVALQEGRGDLLAEAMADRLHQPPRLPLMGPMEEAFAAARAAGALGVCLSGAGPSVLAIVEEGGPAVADAMRRAYEERGITCRTHILQVDHRGAHLVAEPAKGPYPPTGAPAAR